MIILPILFHVEYILIDPDRHVKTLIGKPTMNEGKLQFHFEGPQAHDDARDLADFVKHELPDWPAQTARDAGVVPGGGMVRGVDLETLTFLLSIPSGVLAVWDLATRMQLKAKIDRLIAWAKERRARGQRNPFIVLHPDHKAVSLDEAPAHKILDVIAVQAKSPAKDKP